MSSLWGWYSMCSVNEITSKLSRSASITRMVGQTFPSEKTVCWCRSVFKVLYPGTSGKMMVLELLWECSWEKIKVDTKNTIKRGWNFMILVLSKLGNNRLCFNFPITFYKLITLKKYSFASQNLTHITINKFLRFPKACINKFLTKFASSKKCVPLAQRLDHSGTLEPFPLRGGQGGHSLWNVPGSERIYGVHSLLFGQCAGVPYHDVLFGVHQQTFDQVEVL